MKEEKNIQKNNDEILKNRIKDSILFDAEMKNKLLSSDIPEESEAVISDFFDEFLSMENEILNIINQEMPVILKKMIWYIENENSVLDKQKVMAEIENDNLF